MTQMCHATNRQGKQCGRYATTGHRVCRYHGAAAPRAKARVARDRAEQGALAALARMNVQPIDNPLTELHDLGGEARAWKQILREQVAKLTSVGYSAESGEQIKAAVTLYGQALDRLERVLTSIARLKIDDRLAAIKQAQAEVIVGAIDEVLKWLQLDDEHREQARALAAEALRAAADPSHKRAPWPESPDLYRIVEVPVYPQGQPRQIGPAVGARDPERHVRELVAQQLEDDAEAPVDPSPPAASGDGRPWTPHPLLGVDVDAFGRPK